MVRQVRCDKISFMKQTTKLTNLFLFPAVAVYLWLILSCNNDGTYFCNNILSFVWFVAILFFLTSIYVAITSSMESLSHNVKRVLKLSGVFLLLGMLLTMATWPITFFHYYVPCKDGTTNCYESETVGYISFTSSGAIEKLNNMLDKFPDENASIISRGSPWPGLAYYYSYLVLREETNKNFHIKEGYFNKEMFFEQSFEYSFLIEVLLIVFYTVKRFITKNPREISVLYTP